jgi:hypothetical protein
MCTLGEYFWMDNMREGLGRARYELRRVRYERIVHRVDVLLAYCPELGQVVPNIRRVFTKPRF